MLADGTVFTGPSLVEVQIPHTILASPDTLTGERNVGGPSYLARYWPVFGSDSHRENRSGRARGRNGERSIPFRGPRRLDEEQVGQPCFLDRHTVSWTARLGGGPAEPL